jgi:uncharacterized protein (TIGR03067 family)
MRRIVVALLAVFVLTAFAPAPFPKPGRRGDSNTAISVPLFQGKWKVESFDIYQQGGQKRRSSFVDHIRVRGNAWTLFNQGDSENATYTIVIGASRPATIDFYSGKVEVKAETRPSMFGLIRRDGNTVQILYAWAQGQNRPRVTSFDTPPADWWLLTLKRMP